MITVSAPFDPITDDELKQIKLIRKQKNVRNIYIYIQKEGLLSLDERIGLLINALKPYRFMHIINNKQDDMIYLDSSLEEKVRCGYFYLAAQGIRNILIDNCCYFSNIVQAQCNESRAIHSKGVAETCVEIAKAHHFNLKKAYQSGMLHDITKKMSEEDSRKIISIWKPEWVSISPKVWHSYTAVVWLKQNMHLNDAKILHAIEHHTLGDGNSDLDYILYIADKTEPNRNYDSSYEINLAKKDLKEGVNLIHEESRKYIYKKEGIHV